MILKHGIEKLLKKENLENVLCREIITELLHETTNPLQIAAFLVLLRAKPETPQELAMIVKVLREKMIPVPTQHTTLDIVGTGGDGLNTVNISTGSAILAASCGIKIAKHGNRAASSLAGSADVLEALGVKINLSPEKISACIDEVGIGFCYSPNFHPLTLSLRNLRKQLNVPTSFNLLGPLLNPTHAAHLVLGVLDESLLQVIAETLRLINCEHSVVVHGAGLDEISCIGPAKIIEVIGNSKNEIIVDPSDLGLSYCKLSDLQGKSAEVNASLLLAAFAGQNQAIAETLILNVAVAAYIYKLFPTIKEAIPFVSDKLYSGEAICLLNTWIEFSND